MISKLHERLGTAGFVISILALIVALSGGAYAATGSLTGKQKKEVEKIAKKYAGKNGAPGAAGAAGAKGDAGATGATGSTGSSGKEGQPGTAGNEGQPGKEGSPWTAGGTLPSNATETGVWGDTLAGPAANHSYPLSLTIPLASAPEPVLVKYAEAEVAGKCPGRGVNGSPPEAEPGFLCVYVMTEENHVENPTFRGKFVDNGGEWEVFEGASPEGTSLWATCSATCAFAGSWAVTAP